MGTVTRREIVALIGGTALGSLSIAAGFPPHATRTTPPSRIEERARKVGDVAPSFSLPASAGALVLGDQLQRGPLVLVFYRGSW